MKKRGVRCRESKPGYWLVFLAVIATIFLFGVAAPDLATAGPMPGAIFTTTIDGEVVNENTHYNKKEDVYLDGGPGPNAPAKAAGLLPGDYYFQVTDPSGKELLSEDPISCRKIRVNAEGVIDYYYPTGTTYTYDNKEKMWLPAGCSHETGTDLDHSELGAITVQLMPYEDTPNNGGVYKVWVTPVEKYEGIDTVPADSDKKASINGELWQPGNFHGFIPAWSKTDNYKVKNPGKDPPPSWLFVKKFHDKNADGVKDENEEEILFWAVDITDPLEVQNTYYTPVQYQLLVEGDHFVTEETPDDTIQTVSYLDGALYSAYPEANPTVVVNYDGAEGIERNVLFGNVGVADPTFCKVYDANANGIRDEGEVGVPGWKFVLSTLDTFGNVLGTEELTAGQDGCASIGGLIPGNYRIEEVLPSSGSWKVTPGSATSFDFQVVSVLEQYEAGYKLYGQVVVNGSNHDGTFNFYNICSGTADFDTKGYWQNKNGLRELDSSEGFVRPYVDALSPYQAPPSDYFELGDEPLDGYFNDGTPVVPAFSDESGPWGGGTWEAEISHFLTDNNGGSSLNYHKEQLAQQLLAFIFNTLLNMEGPGASIVDQYGNYISAEGLILEAVAAWNGNDDGEITRLTGELDWFNNNNAVEFVYEHPCNLTY